MWKSIVIDTYRKIVDMLAAHSVLEDPIIHELHIRIIDLVNSNHNQQLFNERAKEINRQLKERLCSLGNIRLSQEITGVIVSSRELIQGTNSHNTRPVEFAQSRVQDGSISLGGLVMREFVRENDYYVATLLLMNENSPDALTAAKKAYSEGSQLNAKEVEIIERAQRDRWAIPETLTTMLVEQQVRGRFPSVQEYEHLPGLSPIENQRRKLGAVRDAYFLIGKLFSSIALFSYEGKYDTARVSKNADPITALLQAAGKECTAAQIHAVHTIALAHSSHGLNSGELTAQLAGSVRATFPRALIAAFNIRSGVLHSGAIRECMQQTSTYLRSGKELRNI